MLFIDVTINDFANSTVCKNRLKKSSSNVTTIIKQLESDKSWDEKDDFDGDFDFVREENEDGTVSVVIKKGPRRRLKSCQENSCEQTDEGKTYPLDIWFLISEYIRPEDVGRFAGICKTSFAVICTAKFWFGLYKRCYQSVPSLPERLQPECMLRLYGLRTSVIRSLNYMYSPFINRLKAVTTFEKHPDVLLRRQCVLMWHQKQSKDWLYCFKLKEYTNMALPHSRRSETRHQPDLLEMLEDVSANPDENCRLLQVTCLHFIAVPLVLGLTLTSVSLTLSQGFRHHRLQLGFSSGVHTCSYNALGGSNNTTIILDPVINVKVLDWWHPLYPHDDNIEYLLNQE